MQHTAQHIPQTSGRVCAMPEAQVLEDRIRKALERVAQLVVDDLDFLPVFERLEQELAAIQSQNSAIERARQYLSTQH